MVCVSRNSSAALRGAHSSAAAYSVLAHEALVDEAWSEQIAPLLTRRFRRASAQEVEQARAFAYGGSLIQDLGYYPFGSRFFSNLVHYVRSGDFVTALIAESRTLEDTRLRWVRSRTTRATTRRIPP